MLTEWRFQYHLESIMRREPSGRLMHATRTAIVQSGIARTRVSYVGCFPHIPDFKNKFARRLVSPPTFTNFFTETLLAVAQNMLGLAVNT